MQTSDEEIQKLREHILAEIDLTREMSDTEIRAIVSEKCSIYGKQKFLKLSEQEALEPLRYWHSLFPTAPKWVCRSIAVLPNPQL